MLVSISTILLLLRIVLAVPFKESHEVVAIGVDEENMQYSAYRRDGSLYGRFSSDTGSDMMQSIQRRSVDQSSCNLISATDLQQLPGYGNLVQYVLDTFGAGSHTFVTNPTDYPNQTALTCPDGAAVNVDVTSAPNCNNNTGSISGSIVNTTATAKLTFTQGFASDSTFTVTTESAVAKEGKFSAKISFNPKVFTIEAGGEVSVTSTITNKQTNTFETKIDNRYTQDLWLNNPANQSCQGMARSMTCNVGGTGQLSLITTGWMWANYDAATSNKNDKSGAKHFKWAVNMEAILTNVADRETYIKFIGSTTATVSTSYVGICQ